MSFSYSPHLSLSDVHLVRFHVGDTNPEGYYLDDEAIQYFLTTTGSVGDTVIACIRHIITQLSQPDFRKDWLSVSNAEARKGWEKILKDKAQELGVNIGAVATATISKPYRADSYQHTTGTRVDETDADNTSVYDGSP